MSRLPLTVRATPAYLWGGVEPTVLDEQASKGDTVLIGRRIVFEEVDGATCAAPTMTLDRRAAQCLMDDLWRSGFRPSEGTGSAGALAATERHLDDMRAIAFRLLKQEQP